MLERLARWYLRRQIAAYEIAKFAAWNEGFQAGFEKGKAGRS